MACLCSVLILNLHGATWVVSGGPGERAANTALVLHTLGVSNSGVISSSRNPIVGEGPVVAVTVPATDGVGFALSGTGFYLSSVIYLVVGSGLGSQVAIHCACLLSVLCWVWCGMLTLVLGCLLVRV